MKITRDNYEIYFLDYLDSNLDETLVDEFIEFLKQNPDLKEELQLFECVTVPNEETAFSGKQKLYKAADDSPEVNEQRIIAWMEGDLSPEESDSFEEWMNAHPEDRKTVDLFLSTKLEADLAIQYPDKINLYRQPAIRAWFIRSARVAAVLMVAMAIWGLWPDDLSELGVDKVVVQTLPESASTLPHESISEPTANENSSEKSEQASTSQKYADISVNQSEPPTSRPERPFETDEVTKQREPLEFAKLQPREALLTSAEFEPVLADINLTTIVTQHEEVFEDLPVQEKIATRLGVNNFSFSKLVKSGLQVASNISNSRITYETDPTGEIVALSLDTRVLGLHIPVGKE